MIGPTGDFTDAGKYWMEYWDSFIVVIARVIDNSVEDFQLRGKKAPLFCGIGPAVCSDTSLDHDCNDDVEVVSLEEENGYSIVQFRRPLEASDHCDSPIILGVGIW